MPKLLGSSKSWNSIYYHERLDAYFTDTDLSPYTNSIYDVDFDGAVKIEPGLPWYAPLFMYDWCFNWIPSGLATDNNLRKLTDPELQVFKALYG